MDNSNNKNRIISKANRNLYIDQISIIKNNANKKGISESEYLREIIDDFLKRNNLNYGNSINNLK